MITPAPLTMKSTMELVPNLPESFLGTLGGVPRAIEYLNSIVKKHGSANLNTLYTNLVHMIVDKYAISSHLSEDTLLMMLRLCLTGKTVNRDYKINGKALGFLEKETVFFLAPTADPYNFKIIIPLVFVAAYNKRYNLLPQEYFWYRPIKYAHELELFSRHFDVFYNNLLYDIGVRETTFGERYIGAYMSDALAKRKIIISRMTMYASKKDSVTSGFLFDTIESGEKINIKDNCIALWIGRNFTRCDNVYTFPKQSNGTTYAILEELKCTIPYQEATSATIEKQELLSERSMAPDVKFLGSGDIEAFFMFTTNCRLKTREIYCKKKYYQMTALLL